MSKKWNFRQVINTLHLWVGVPCAIVLFIVCLTGTTYVFQKEITRWVDGSKYAMASSTGPRMEVAALAAGLEATNPGLKVTVVQIPEAANEAWLFTLAPPAKKDAGGKKDGVEKKDADGKKDAGAEKAEIKKRTRIFIVNPYTGKVQGDAQSAAYRFFETVIALHRWLLLDHSIGAVITGTSAMLFVLLEITGLILWLPAKLKSWKKWNAWKPGFSVKRKAGWKRVNHDLHKTLGFYTFFLITILGLTGPYFGFEWYKNAFAATLGVKLPKKEVVVVEKEGKKERLDKMGEMDKMERSERLDKMGEMDKMERPERLDKTEKPERQPLALDSMVIAANGVLPYSGDLRLNLPKGAKGVVSLLKVRTGFFASAAVDRIDFEAATGKVKQVDRFADRAFGQKIISVIRAIHTGEIFGTFSKIIYFLVCLIATSLPVTGVMIWLNKRKKKTAPRGRPAAKYELGVPAAAATTTT